MKNLFTWICKTILYFTIPHQDVPLLPIYSLCGNSPRQFKELNSVNSHELDLIKGIRDGLQKFKHTQENLQKSSWIMQWIRLYVKDHTFKLYNAIKGRGNFINNRETFSQVGLSLIVISASARALVTFERFKKAAERLLQKNKDKNRYLWGWNEQK